MSILTCKDTERIQDILNKTDEAIDIMLSMTGTMIGTAEDLRDHIRDPLAHENVLGQVAELKPMFHDEAGTIYTGPVLLQLGEYGTEPDSRGVVLGINYVTPEPTT